MKIIGLTGGIGSGKSVVSQLFEVLGIPVYYTDTEAKRIMVTSDRVKEKLIQKFGHELYNNNRLDRAMLAQLIFNDTQMLTYVNSVVHPEVRKDFISWTHRYNHKPYTAVESAILFESGLNQHVDISITVVAPLEVRVERVRKRDGISKEAVLSRIKNQMKQEEKIKLSDQILINDDTKALIPQVESLINQL